MGPAIISLIILAVCIILFITKPIPNAATACLGCLLFSLTGICSIGEAFSGFSNTTVLLMFGMMIVGIAMMDTGVAKVIGERVSKWSAHNERLFILVAGLVSGILSTFLSNTAVIAIFLPIITSVSLSDSKMNRLNLTLPVTLGAMFGGVCTLVGSTPQLTANGILKEMCSGKELKMFDYTFPGAIIFVVYILYVVLVGPKLGRHIWGKRPTENNTNNGTDEAATPRKINKFKIICMLVIFGLTVVFFIGGWLTTETTAICAALLCIIFECTSVKTVFKQMDWSVVFVLAGCLGIAKGITKSGAGDMIGDMLSSVLNENIPPLIIFAVFVLMTMIISNFITNSTAVTIMLPIAIPLCLSVGLNPIAFTLGIVFAANLTFSTPLANAQTAMTLVAGYKFSDYIRYTWPLDLLVLASIIVTVPLFFPLAV